MALRYSILFLLVLSGLLPVARASSQELFSGRTFGGSVQYQVKFYGGSKPVDTELIKSKVKNRLDEINSLMSTYVKDSDVSRFNASTSTDWIAVDAEVVRVVQRSLEISRQTDGAFDVTVGPLVRRWNFGPGKAEKFQLPTQEEIDELLQRVGYKNLEIRNDPPALRKKNVPELEIDLSAIAKGYSVDSVAETLIEDGISSFMVEVGGEVRVGDPKPDGSAWAVGINDPATPLVNRSIAVANLKNQSMATSGDYRNAHWINGKRYSHTIDPKTGWPVEHNLASSSIVVADCLSADAFATAAMVLGDQKSLDNAKSWDVEIYNLSRNEDGSAQAFSATQTDSFPLKDFSATKPSTNWTIAIAVFAFLLAIIGMSVGVIFSNRRIQGSCGGIASLQEKQGEDVACSMCSNPSDECKELREAMERKKATESQS